MLITSSLNKKIKEFFAHNHLYYSVSNLHDKQVRCYKIGEERSAGSFRKGFLLACASRNMLSATINFGFF